MNTRQLPATALLALLAGSPSTATAQSTDPFPTQFELSSLLPANGGTGANGFVLYGEEQVGFSSTFVSSAGDVNGDGIDDLVIGASRADPNGKSFAGESYVVFGSEAAGAGGPIELSSLNGSNGFVLNGIDGGDSSGTSVSSAGDVNGDGIDDLIVGAYGADPNGNSSAGESYVVFGGVGVGAGGTVELSSLNGVNGFVLNGIDAGDGSGLAVSTAGDVNGDGFDDVVIGADFADPNGQDFAGESYVVFGGAGVGAGGVIELSSLNGTNGFVLNGFDGQSGYSVSSAGDVNGDGFDDVVIGAIGVSPNGTYLGGQSYVVFGGSGVGAGGVIELSSLNGTNGFALNGMANDFSGFAVSSAGDVNGDGLGDILIGAPNFTPDGAPPGPGRGYVVFGAAGVHVGGAVELSSLNGINGFVLNGIDVGDSSGISVSSAGDVNGDGIDDLIVGAIDGSPNGIFRAGESYVVFGGVGVGTGGVMELSSINGTNGFVLNGVDEYDRSGSSVSAAGDVNGDGIDDVIIGANTSDPTSSESYLVFGRANGQRWVSPAGGDWDTGSNWQEGASPVIGIATIETPLGVTVTGPDGAVFLDTLNLAATLGRTTIDLQPGSLLSLNNPFTLPASAALAGSGLFVANDTLTNHGLITMDAMGLVAPAGLDNQPDGTIAPTDALIVGPVSNSGTVRLSTVGAAVPAVSLELTDELTNETTGQLILRGDARLNAPAGLTNDGSLAIAFATTDILGPVNNSAAGTVSISGASNALFTDDVTNASQIVLTGDSALVILGKIFGNGVSGPAGAGTAGSVYVEGGIIPGLLSNPFATARFDGDLDLGLSAVTTIEIAGTTPGADLDQIAAQHLAVAGTLQIVLANGYTPQPGDVYQVLDFITITGTFSSIVLDPALISAGADTTDLLTNGTIFIAAPCPADTNGDGFLDLGDIQTFVALFLDGNPAADLNNDGFLDLGDIQNYVALFLEGC